MIVLGHKAKTGDSITLTRKDNRITVEFKQDVLHIFSDMVIGFQDTENSTWYTDGRAGSWVPMGITVAPVPVTLPEVDGWYLLTGDNQEEQFEPHVVQRYTPVYQTHMHYWFEGGPSAEMLNETYLKENGPLLRLGVPGEHFTAVSSTGDKYYDLYLNEDGTVSCNCLGYENRQNCRHSKDWKRVLDLAQDS